MSNLKIAYCMMGTNALWWVRERFNEMASYVDRMIYIDGGSIDDTLVYMRNRTDVETYLHPWKDDYAGQRNNYLAHAKKDPRPDWIVVSDHDESFSLKFRQNLRSIISEAEFHGFNKIDIQCKLVYLSGDNVDSIELRPFWKPLIFKNIDGLYYEGSPHETFHNPSGWKEMRIGSDDIFYYHIRHKNIIWSKGARNFVVSGGAMLYDKNPHYVEFKEALKKDGHELDSVKFNKLMIDGKVGKHTVKWIVDHKDINDPSLPANCCSEMRECYLTYFKLYHPELEEING